ncbi:MAG: SDR family oxidoreductase [Enterococcus lacertideformus]|uniref:SDR family oxidoreductase n=1 Tax=Enterococcus lacertideformus TaxID=2771493 RepID=A0A931AWX1_9ENTE|nr:SDR family oxidoreductase [Enterococcus lacertideformus]
MTYLIKGATGGFGKYAQQYLKELVSQDEIYVLVRTPEKGRAFSEEGWNVRIGDYADLSAMKQALKGIDRLLFISGVPGNRQAEHRNVVTAAKESGVSYIAYTSFADVEHSTSVLAPDHQFTEKIIKSSGIHHTFLRNNWYLENELPLIHRALKSGQFVYSAGEGKTGWALKREYAEVAAKALAGADFPEILELSGKPVTYKELAKALKEVTGSSIEIVSTTEQTFMKILEQEGIPKSGIQMLIAIQRDIKNHQLDVSSKDFEEALGKPLVSLPEGLKELLK